MRILLVDDHPVVRQGIRAILVERLENAIVGEASDADSALRYLGSERWDIVIADISLPGSSGLDLIKEIQRLHPDVPILVLSMHPAAQFARRAMAAGAAGYLTKDSPPEELIDAIENVRKGRPYLSRASAPMVRHWATRTAVTTHEMLSDREYQVLRMLGTGQTISDIARDLGLSVKTVSTYRERVLEKLGLETNAELIRYAIEQGLADA
jgi:two-component system invasion response regulator UvrY